MPNELKPTLRPCPFCGGEAEIAKNGCGYIDVSCKNETCRGYAHSLWHKEKRKAVAAWNRRANDE